MIVDHLVNGERLERRLTERFRDRKHTQKVSGYGRMKSSEFENSFLHILRVEKIVNAAKVYPTIDPLCL